MKTDQRRPSEARETEAPFEFCGGAIVPPDEAQKWLASCGVNVKIFKGCRIIHPQRVQIGDFTQIDEGVCIFGGEGVELGRHVHLAVGSSISGGGRCAIKDFAGIGFGVRLITGSESIDGSGLTNPTVPADLRPVQRGWIEIGAHAVVFTNSIVMPNVRIGEGAVVSAGSTVHHDLRPWGIYGGNPLVKIGLRSSEKIIKLAAELSARESPRQ